MVNIGKVIFKSLERLGESIILLILLFFLIKFLIKGMRFRFM